MLQMIKCKAKRIYPSKSLLNNEITKMEMIILFTNYFLSSQN